ncbi:sodium:solute symporter family protein [Halobacillus naozhouensis]|uniref:Sodium:solute symporter family protein n=1 Tax=Halobacillus naozhouensis TaxID=554880 RepID=A0ABY8IWY1_9BACI|nr:sodium:solute symporter family protein [Halobacillus naozhouensis]WFT74733.1 sodium:solute symporter family protein [Halobacillus naozhouensis]
MVKKSDPNKSFLQKNGPLLLLAVLLAAFVVYIALTNDDILWSGFIAMLVFYAIVYYIGAFFATKQSESLSDMMVAKRSLPLGVAMFTMAATWVGGGYINGTAEFTYSDGLVWAQAPWGYALSLIIGGIFYARKMRRYEFMTILDPLEQRFGKKMAGVLYIPALLGEMFWSAAILTALGTTFGTILNIDFTTSIILSGAIAIAYTVAGGMWAVAYTDVFQMAVLLLGLFLVVPFALGQVGGLESAWSSYSAEFGSYANLFPPLNGWQDPAWGNWYWNWIDYALLLIFGGIAWQVYFQRVLSAKSEKTAMWFSIIAGIICLIAAVPAVIIGVVGSNIDWAAMGLPTPENAAVILPHVLRYLTPEVIAAIGLGALAAAVMSSMDSSILSASSMASWNVYRPLINPHASADKLKKVIKRTIIIVGVGSMIIALNVQSVYTLWYLASDLVYTILFPQLTMALFYKNANLYGSIAGFVVALFLRIGGGEPALGLPAFLPYPMITDGGIVLFPFRTLACVSAFVMIYVVSELTKKTCKPKSLVMPGDKEQAEQKLSS